MNKCADCKFWKKKFEKMRPTQDIATCTKLSMMDPANGVSVIFGLENDEEIIEEGYNTGINFGCIYFMPTSKLSKIFHRGRLPLFRSLHQPDFKIDIHNNQKPPEVLTLLSGGKP